MKAGCIGELVVDFISLAQTRSIEEASHFQKCPGGSPANVAAALHQQGIEVAFISRVGADGMGDFVRNAVTAKGLVVNNIAIDKKHPTRCIFIAYDREGRRSIEIANRDSADQHMESSQIAPGLIDELDLLHVGGTTLLSEETGGLTLGLVDQVKKKGGIISFDPNIRLKRVSGTVRDRLLRLLPSVDILKTNEDELRALEEMLPQAPASLPAISVCTRGAAGAAIMSRGGVIEVAARPAKVVDPTGAGDAFFAGFLGYLFRHAADPLNASPSVLERSGEAGSAHASRVIQHLGGVLAGPG